MDNKFVINIGGVQLDLRRPAVMAIINVTPDSFWEGSRRGSDAASIRQWVDRAVGEGASILDVGGYSSRPGADEVPPDEEYDRVARAVGIIRESHPETVVSIDTFRASVARRVVENFGSCIINDISAGELDPEMVPVVASLGVPYIAMHMRGTPRDMQQRTGYDDITAEVRDYLAARAQTLKEAGVTGVILDPGFGFAKTAADNYQLLDGLSQIAALGYPVLSGVSRKSMIYKVLDITPAEALPGTVALNWESLRQGASILRVHDVREAVELVKLHGFYNKAIKKDIPNGTYD